MMLLIPTWESVRGVNKKSYPLEGDVFFGNFKSYGGTEIEKNNILVIEDTATIETWFNPDIKSDCAIKFEDGRVYEIINEPENIENRNQFMKFKVRRLKGGY